MSNSSRRCAVVIVAILGLGACRGQAPASPEAPAVAPAPPPLPGAPRAKAKAKAKAAVDKVPVKVWFVDQPKYAAGAPGYLVEVERMAGAQNPPRNALWMLFKGPNPKEREAGLALVDSGADGFSDLRIEGGIARVQLKGGCAGGGATLTVYDLIVPTLKQFDEVQHVKVYDPQGATMNPDGPSDSRPACLEP